VSGTASSTNNPVSDTVDLSLPSLDCPGFVGDLMQVAFRVRQVAGPLDCAQLVVSGPVRAAVLRRGRRGETRVSTNAGEPRAPT
jgi:hypothetical protein